MLCAKCTKLLAGDAPTKREKPPKTPKPKQAKVRNINSKVRGVSQINEDGSDRQQLIKYCRAGERLMLRREPRNRHDRNAIAVLISDGSQLGYIGTELAETLAPLLDEGIAVDVVISEITGGGTWFSPQHRGVNIRISYTELR